MALYRVCGRGAAQAGRVSGGAALHKETAGPTFNEGQQEQLLERPPRSSHSIALAMHRAGPTPPKTGEVAAVACAAQHRALPAHAYGLGGFRSSGGIRCTGAAEAFFGLGPADKLLGFFNLGCVRVPAPASKRGPAQDKVTWVNA